jgi:hypothetical protein
VDKPITTNPKVVGAIGRKEFNLFWRETLKAPQDVLDIVEEGYRIPFASFSPPDGDLPNNRSALEDPDFVEEQLFMLERIGCIRKAAKKPKIVMPLSVVFSNKKRLIVDGSRNLNPFIKDLKVNLSHLEAANAGLTPGSYMMSCDLESGYYQVPIHKSHRKFLGVAWTSKGGRTVYFEWMVLFLGIKSAVHVFTKCLRPHIRFCQLWGISVIIYIDDQRIDAPSLDQCQVHSDFAKLCLELAGWCLKPGKGIRAPTQDGVFLGMGHDLRTLHYFIP